MRLLSRFMSEEKHPLSPLEISIKNILKPLARLLIKFEISHGKFTEYSRIAFAEAAYDYFKLPKKKMTFARVAVLTGLSRKQVISLLSDNTNTPSTPKISQSRTSRVILGWVSDDNFCHNGVPKALSLRKGPYSFIKLVEKYSGDMSVRSVLDEMLCSNIVAQDGDKLTLVNLNGEPPEDDLEKFRVLSTSVGDLLSTGIHNIYEEDKESLRFQREYIRNNVPLELVEEFKAYTNIKSQELLADYVSWIRNKSKSAPTKEISKETKRTGIGIYYFEND